MKSVVPTRAGRPRTSCRNASRYFSGAVFIMTLAICQPLAAQQVDAAPDDAIPHNVEPHDVIIVPEGQGSGGSGRVAINIAAGNGNQQLGNAVVARGDVALTGVQVHQFLASPAGSSAAATTGSSITVEDGAFSGNSGLVSINLTAGQQNQSANLAVLAIGTQGVMSDQLLAQSRAATEPSGGNEARPAEADDTVAIGDDAFADSSGLLQVNLIGGERNSSANTFSLNVSAGGQP